MRGIYKITNKINNKVYIGESLNIERRWKEHIEDLDNAKHHSYKLQNDWNTYGKDNFAFEIIKTLDDSISSFIDKYILVIYESKCINEYDSINKGYNIEKTIDKVLNDEKIIQRKGMDSKMMSVYLEKINNDEIKDLNGIIYKDSFILNDLLKYLNIDYRKLKTLLKENKLILKTIDDDETSFILNEQIFNKEDIILNDNYKKIKFNRNLYLDIINKLNKNIEEEK